MSLALTPAIAARRAVWLAAGLALAGSGWAATLNLQVQGRQGQVLGDAVLMLEPLDAKATLRPAEGIEIAQQGRQFVPLVSLVPVGTRISFPNRDRVRHHIYSFSEPKKFEIKLYVGKPESPIEFDRAGIVVLGCNIHDTMVGWIVVSDTPWAGKTNAAGLLSLADVPPGHYRLRSWHPDLPPGAALPEQMLSVGSATIDLKLQLEAGLR